MAMTPADIFPSVYLTPNKVIELLVWWLNPLEKPPQRLLSLSQPNNKHSIFSNLLKKEGFSSFDVIVDNYSLPSDFALNKELFNLVYFFEFTPSNLEQQEKIIDFFKVIHNGLLKASSYLILELKFSSEEEIDNIEDMLQEAGFNSISVLTPDFSNTSKTNPFKGVDVLRQHYCWLTALSQQSEEDPLEWINEYVEN